MLCVSMRSVSSKQNIGLLSSGGHAGGWARTLNVDQYGRHFGKITEAEEFVHQTDARSTRCGKGSSPVPGCAHYHTDGSEFILSLHDGVIVLSGNRIDPVFLSVLG